MAWFVDLQSDDQCNLVDCVARKAKVMFPSSRKGMKLISARANWLAHFRRRYGMKKC